MSAFHPTLEELPETLPIFPLAGVLLLPRCQLPLNIFEPRYLNMTLDALAAEQRLIGMMQPTDPEAQEPPVYNVGCAGRIVRFEETEDGRFLITLRGVARFRVAEELAGRRGYRLVRADWRSYARDLEDEEQEGVDRKRLLASLKSYFKLHKIEANWDAVANSHTERLVNSLAMVCPFEPQEKQALLEAKTLGDRMQVLTALVEMAVLETSHGEGNRQ